MADGRLQFISSWEHCRAWSGDGMDAWLAFLTAHFPTLDTLARQCKEVVT